MPDDVRRDDISYKIGDDRPIAWELLEVDGDQLAAGSAWRAHAQVRGPSGDLLHDWSSAGNGRARIVEHDDSWWVELLVEGSRAWTWSRGTYDVFVIDPDGRAQPIAEGTWVNRPAVTSWSDSG